MRAIVVEQPGDPSVLHLGELPDPTPLAGELLVAVRAAGVNRADLLQRAGFYPPPPGEPATIGLEVAGEVVTLGPGCEGKGPGGRSFRVGDRVMALLAGGGYASLARVPVGQALPIPKQLSFAEAAAIPEVFLTAWLNLFLLGELKAGEVVVVHAAGSGVGTAALQLCRGIARVVLATASQGKLEQLRAFGATHLLARDRVEEQLAAAVEAASGGGASLILDLVGGSYLEANIAALGMHGRLACVATAGGTTGTLDLLSLLRKRLTVRGSTLRTRSKEQKAKLCADFAARALQRFDTGELRPVLARTFPLAEAHRAHALLANNEVVGKLVLEV